MRTWAPVFHFYQPPTQKMAITKEVYKTSYKPFLDVIQNHPEVSLTVNIAGSLIEQLNQIKCTEFFDQLSRLVQNNQIELVTSAMYHPLLPLIDSASIVRQVNQNTATLQQRTGITPLPVLFPPELAINLKVLDAAHPLVEYSLIDESSINPAVSLKKIPSHAFYEYQGLKLLVSSRAITEVLRAYPTRINPEKFVSFFLEHTDEDSTVISMNDVELFGHHYSDRFELLTAVIEDPRIELSTISNVISLPHDYQNITPHASTWVSTIEQLKDNEPFVLWNNIRNQLQRDYVLFMDFCSKALLSFSDKERAEGDIFTYAERYFDIGCSSCHLYWLSSWPWWHPDLAEKGTRNLLRTVRSLPLDKETKIEAEEIYSRFIKDLWTRHWEGTQNEKIAEFDAYREDFLKTLPDLG